MSKVKSEILEKPKPEIVEPNELHGDQTRLDRPLPYALPVTTCIMGNVHRVRAGGKDILEVLRTKAGIAGDDETKYLTIVIVDALNRYAEGK